MNGFVDETEIEVISGNGGAGCVSFRREKYVPHGGPDGGDGGKGGDVIFSVKRNLNTLSHLKSRHKFRGKNGEPGMGRKKHGKNGDAIIIPVPPGTIIRESASNMILKDFGDEKEGTEWVLLHGGRGGQGNWHFRTSRKQTPRFSQPGAAGESSCLKIELNMIADIGLVGFPNAGKSSLLKQLTNANPAIAPYPFTTKIPNLGIFRIFDRDIVIADIPGIIDGASHGLGLGFQFLKHITRTSCLAFLIDLSDDNYLDAFSTLLAELKTFSPALAKKQRIILGTKIDLEGTAERLIELQKHLPKENIIETSSFDDSHLSSIKESFIELTVAKEKQDAEKKEIEDKKIAKDKKIAQNETPVPFYYTEAANQTNSDDKTKDGSGESS